MKKVNDGLIIVVDKKTKKALAYEGNTKTLEADIYGARHPKYRWKIEDMRLTKNEGCIEFIKDDVEERTKLIKGIAKKLKGQVNVEEFLKDKLEDQRLDDLKDIHERLMGKKIKVSNKEGCFYLDIGGKKGRPKRLDLSE